MKTLVACLLVGLLLPTMVCAQGVGSSGDIRGTVKDSSGAFLPHVPVSVTDTATGFERTTTSGDAGEFHLTGLPPATYDVTAKGAGFATEIRKGVVVSLGRTVVIDFQLSPASVSTVVEVNGEPPLVETTRGSQADSINQQYITELPIDRRDYLTFTLLMPGVSNATRLASDQDFRVKQTPQSGLSFYGSNGRGNNVTVDGGESNDDTGGVRPNLSQDAVQEFQINRSNYGAELGGASGASINIVSKSGTNRVHGSLYGFFRNDALDARDRFAFSQALQPGQAFDPAQPDATGRPVKNTLSRQQFGGSIGFPIKKDRTFLFLSFEGLRQNAQNAVPLLTDTSIFRPQSTPQNDQVAILNGLATEPGNPMVPCITTNPLNPTQSPQFLPANLCALALENVLTLNTTPNPFVSPGQAALNGFLLNQFETNGGVFPYQSREYQFSARVDHRFSNNNQVFLRYNFTHDLEESPDVQSLIGFSRGSSIHDYDHTIQGNWFHQFSPATQNELLLQWNYFNFDVIPNVPAQPGLDIPGFANFGTQIFIPNLSILRRTEVGDNFTTVHGSHTFKFGGQFLERGNHTESHTFFPGRFVFGNLPGAVLSLCLQAPVACGLSPSINPATINSLQSASLGAPQFYEQGFGSPIYNYPRPFAGMYWQDSWQVRPNFTLNYGLRYELDAQYGQLHTDKDNFAPRVSFAWDPLGDHKTAIRGGFGIFYSQVYGQIADVVHTLGNVNGTRQIANILIPLTGDPLNPAVTSASIFGGLFAQGKIQCTTPAPGNAACITPADLAPLGVTVSNTGPLPPLTVIFTGQPNYQNPYSEQASLGVERELGNGLSISLSGIYSHTLRLPVAIDTNALPAPLSTAVLANGQTVRYRNWGGPGCAGLLIFNCFVDPLILQSDQYSSKASALYEGGILEVRKRFSSHFTFVGNYTYSKAFDTTTDFNSDFGPADNTNLSAERGLSDFDQRHKLVVAGVLQSPWANPVLSGFELSPIVSYNSGHPFNLLAGADVNGDRHSTNDRPIGAGRNTGIGPNYVTLDMRLARSVKLSEKANVQLLAEGFNLTNRTNFASVNNVVGPLFGLPLSAGGAGAATFNVHGNAALSPSQPLGFTSIFAAREIQLGVRLSF
ncbi:MAG TPA: TonB-dependent receptor [Terriglobales bacterium]|nr:TonB-dependent receptor [Terriglobales bacterium]